MLDNIMQVEYEAQEARELFETALAHYENSTIAQHHRTKADAKIMRDALRAIDVLKMNPHKKVIICEFELTILSIWYDKNTLLSEREFHYGIPQTTAKTANPEEIRAKGYLQLADAIEKIQKKDKTYWDNALATESKPKTQSKIPPGFNQPQDPLK